MAIEEALRRLSRPVTILAAGGTISMRGERAVPALDAQDLVESIPELAAVPDLHAESMFGLPGSHLSLADALSIGQQATARAAAGHGVVITSGTDTLEELAALCALLHDGECPVTLTGANRPASAPGADGPANLLDAVAVAGAEPAAGLGTCVCFGGEVHGAMRVRKVDSTGPAAFGSPGSGPVGRVVEGRLWLHARPLKPPTLTPSELRHRVELVTAVLGDDGSMLARALHEADGVVLAALGAGHVPPALLMELRTAEKPVLVTSRVDRSSMLFDTYGFAGSESDVRRTGAVCVPFLSGPAARIALLCCLGAGLTRAELAVTLSAFDAA